MMKGQGKNDNEFIMNAFIIGLFLMLVMGFHDNSPSVSRAPESNSTIITEHPAVHCSAVLTAPVVLPSFDYTWITSKSNFLIPDAINLCAFITNRLNSKKLVVSRSTYLDFKPLTIFTATCSIHSSEPGEAYPPLA